MWFLRPFIPWNYVYNSVFLDQFYQFGHGQTCQMKCMLVTSISFRRVVGKLEGGHGARPDWNNLMRDYKIKEQRHGLSYSTRLAGFTRYCASCFWWLPPLTWESKQLSQNEFEFYIKELTVSELQDYRSSLSDTSYRKFITFSSLPVPVSPFFISHQTLSQARNG